MALDTRLPQRTIRRKLAFLAPLLFIPHEGSGAEPRRLEVPEPSFPVTEESASARPAASTFQLPVRVALGPIVVALDGAISRESDTGEAFVTHSDTAEIRYGLSREPFTLSTRNDRFDLGCRMHYWLEARGPEFGEAACGKPQEPIRVDAGCQGRVGWLADFRIGSRSEVLPTVFARRCKPDPPKINFTPVLSDQIYAWALLPLAKQADSLLAARLDLRPAIDEVWQALHVPVRLPGEGWLVYDPEAITTGPVQFLGDSLAVDLGFLVHPRLVRGERPEASAGILPEPKARLIDDRIEVEFTSEVPCAHIDQVLMDRLSKDRQPSGGEGQLWITGIRSAGHGDMLFLAADLAGEVTGTVFFVGKLVLEPIKLTLMVDGLALSAETEKALSDPVHQAPNFAPGTRLDELRQELEAALRFDLRQPVTADLARIGRGLNHRMSTHVTIEGGAMDRRILGVRATRQVVVARLAAAGKASLKLE